MKFAKKDTRISVKKSLFTTKDNMILYSIDIIFKSTDQRQFILWKFKIRDKRQSSFFSLNDPTDQEFKPFCIVKSEGLLTLSSDVWWVNSWVGPGSKLRFYLFTTFDIREKTTCLFVYTFNVEPRLTLTVLINGHFCRADDTVTLFYQIKSHLIRKL